MTPATPLIEAIGADRILHITQSMVRCRAQLAPSDQQRLDDAVLEFLARNPLAVATILLDQVLPKTHPGAVEALLKRAHERAGDTGRNRIEEHALAVGFHDLFAKSRTQESGFLTRSQRVGLKRMVALAKLHFEGRSPYGIEVRTWPLLVGPSGVGKSNLARQVAATLGGLPLVKLCYGEWLVSGAKGDVPTLQRLRLAVQKHERLVLFVDELCKVHATADPWSRSLLTELFGVLDGQLGVIEGTQPGWTPELVDKLRRNVFIVGAGTWQELWQTPSSGGLGFGRESHRPAIAERIRKAAIIPAELLNRFCPSWVFLEPYTSEDFQEIAAGLGLPPGVLDPVQAAESGLNFRAIQAAVTLHSLSQPEA